jgi:tetratricopeptide (TPR) repeat protein
VSDGAGERSGRASAGALAGEALRVARLDPRRARGLAERAADLAEESGDFRAASTAARALGLAARELYDLPGSVAHLRRAIRISHRNGDARGVAQARMTLTATLAVQGDWVGALREADLAAPALRGQDLALLRLQRGTVLAGQGRLDEAIAAYGQALPALRRSGDTAWAALLLTNRGLARFQRGDLAVSESDLRKAEALFSEIGHGRAVARVYQSLGLVASRRGDLPAALEWFDRAERWFGDHGYVEAMVYHDRCDALLAARLVAESRRCAEAAVRTLTEEGRLSYAATARLKLAEAALADGDAATARATADQAARALSHQRRPALAALARQVSLRAAWTVGERSPSLLNRARRNANALEAAGFALHALDARLLAAQVAIDLGRTGVARTELGRARRARNRAPAQIRARAWHAEALLRLSCGSRRGAEGALQAGMRVVDRYRIALGATELRANASGHVIELAALGLRLAIEEGDPRKVLAWAERGRAASALLRPARPPDDAQLAAGLGALRAVVAEMEAQAAAGRPTSRLAARQAELEDAVRDRARCATGVLAASVAPTPPLPAMLAALDDATLVEIVESDGELHAVSKRAHRLTLRRLGAATDAASELDRLRFSLRRLAFRTGSAASREAANASAAYSAQVLNDVLLGPLDLGDDLVPAVIVPTGRFHAMPWSVLPSLRRRPVTVAPSLAAWHRAATAPTSGATATVFTAGPNLDHAAAEVRALAALYPGARLLTAGRATCRAVLEAVDGAALAHVAAHGRFRSDNPLFSCLELADGPLTVYDLEGLAAAPETLVLAACDVGLSDVRPGDELMGLAAAVLALGTRTLIASVFPVPDEGTRSMMLAFHANARRGLGPAAALAAARASTSCEGPVGAAFTCFGAG